MKKPATKPKSAKPLFKSKTKLGVMTSTAAELKLAEAYENKKRADKEFLSAVKAAAR